MIACRVVGVNQGMDFESNTAQTFLVLELPTGERVQAAVDDDTAMKVISLQVRTRGVPQAVQRVATPPAAPLSVPAAQDAPADVLEEVETADGPAFIFGGQDDTAALAPTEEAAVYDAPPEEVAPPPPKPAGAQRRTRKNASAPSRSVAKNEFGYPIIQGGTDPDQLTGTHNQDEDGVGSI